MKKQEPRTRLNSYGEIVEDFTTEKSRVFGKTEYGEAYYAEGNNSYLDYMQKGGKQTKVKVRKSLLGPVVNDYINYLSAKGKVDLAQIKSSDIIMLEGELPGVTKVGKAHEYSGRCAVISSTDSEGRSTEKYIIIVDSRLTDAEKITTLYHELVHARGETNDRPTHIETIHGLREMLKSYNELLKDEDSQEKYFYSDNREPEMLEGHGHKKGTLREAVNYAIQSKGSMDVTYQDIKDKLRKSKRAGATGKLEKIVGITFTVIAIFFIVLLNCNGITGFSIFGVGTGAVSIGLAIILLICFTLIKYYTREK